MLACLILPSTVIFSPRSHFILVTGNATVGGLPQLSHDVLVHIFSFIIPKAYLLNTHQFKVSTHLHTSRSPPPEHFIAFSQVCRHWRQVALATPTLWNAPLWDHLSPGALMLERASTAPLTVIWPPIEGPNGRFVLNNSRGRQRPPQAAELIAALDGHVSRISELDLVGGGDDFEVTLNYVLSNSITLTSLRLSFERYPVNKFRKFDYRDREIFSEIPVLEHLALTNCFIQLPSISNQIIKTLAIHMSDQKLIPMNDILNLLVETPKLASLHLIDAMGERNGIIIGPIKLPELHTLIIKGDSRMIQPFLLHLQISSVSRLGLVAARGSGDKARTADFYETALLHHMAAGHNYQRLSLVSSRYTTMVLAGHEPGLTDLHSWNAPYYDLYEPDIDSCTPIEAEMFIKLDGQFLICAWDPIIQYGHDLWSSLGTLEILCFDWKATGSLVAYGSSQAHAHGYPCDFGNTAWPWPSLRPGDYKSMLVAMPQLEVIRVSGDTAGHPLLQALARDNVPLSDHGTRQQHARHHTPMLCPHLHTLHLHMMSLALSWPSKGNDHINPITDNLQLIVRARHAYGMPIRKLHAEQAELRGDGRKETDHWRMYFQSWVNHVEIEVVPCGTRSKKPSPSTGVSWSWWDFVGDVVYSLSQGL